MTLAQALLAAVRAALLTRRSLLLENVALRHQLTVLRRQITQPQLKDRDRLFWLVMRRLHAGWRDCLHLVQPDTVLKWHRMGWRATGVGRAGAPSVAGHPSPGGSCT